MGDVAFALHPIPPFRLDLTAWALRRRASNTIDGWDGRVYSRAILVDDHPVAVEASQSGTAAHPKLEVVVRGDAPPARAKKVAAAVLRRALGLDVDLRPFYRLADADPRLGPLARQFRGLKPPRFPSVFEGVVNGIACQQLSLAVGIILLDRLTDRCGLSVDGSGAHVFPRARDIAVRHPSDLRPLGFSFNKVRALLELSRGVEAGLDLESLEADDEDTALARLIALRGVGRWTAEYVLLRGLGRWHLFPGDDVGARTNLARWMKLEEPLDYDQVRQLSQHWAPYGGLLYFHLLLKQLHERGAL